MACPHRERGEEVIERHRKIVDLVRQGYYMTDVAKMVGVTQSVVSRVVKKHGVTPVRFTHPQYKKIVTLLRERVPAMEISRRLGVNRGTVTRIRKSEGIPSYRQKRVVSAERLERAARLLNDGASYAEVSRTLSMSTGTLRKYFPGMAWGRAQIDEYLSMVQESIKAEKRVAKEGGLTGHVGIR